MALIHKPTLRRSGFTFKQFFVGHDKCAMKVGTDGVLLGAWAPVYNKNKCLDIGCGSGLIALMIAQRTKESTVIDAVELDSLAAMQAIDNVQQSPWPSRITIHQQDIHDFTQQHVQQNGLRKNSIQYDLIMSNPPYFEPAVACRNEARNQARYTESLTHQGLLECARKLITSTGLFCVVLPYDIGEFFEKRASELGWFTHHRVNIRDRQDKPLHRLLLGLSLQPQDTQVSELTIRALDGTYSDGFRQLVTDFYLYY
ncbi:methyltransferase [Xenorhabdus nematophila]|uniref:tRNA1(Val) (adenine(37)-N6)-methyltransferase n=1 Tax=Xenorhabdus nematophila (strain ATCC 19061 / DSM 3370 / CCUG 14189 / LMG 1036 / NCIMB 9965 / AN6) TaxID=406817 RepID=D3VLJ2_XENNA|nr:methyltransferase [Xenorhabdus nematophila]CEE91160.1 putative methyltransferase with S-adenosyl-L-methionine-dependent methyltransferase domain [Xenorhabdus nematophila str. Anatoliense]CEF32803.1 putative methyltransferase with S-adenosyl-L-methionine-dependent methyltransferase domain [Xenorhabdus nematophila str. Websteri]AYA39433.1 methyltransferase domain-containing protein [Xenorhabdus nematophila]KHD28422.1 tRNA (adenine-N6)-methyltransferase [Xenorhabdus nematophila]MBA0017999.1 me